MPLIETVFRFALSADQALRLFEESDVESLYALIERNRSYLSPWLPWAEQQTLEGTRAFIRMGRKQLADNDGFQAAITRARPDHRLDRLSPRGLAAPRDGIGYWLAADAPGAGNDDAGRERAAGFAFRAWRLNRVEIRAAVENRRSRAIPERLGFQLEGTLRQAEFVRGRYLDHAVYSMLSAEWGSRTAVPSKAPARRSESASSARSSG